MGRVVGVAIGGDAIRATEVASGRHPHVRACTTVALRPGAVQGGDPVDPDVVAETLRAAWSTGRFKTKDMIPLLDGRQAVMRLVDLPAMPEADLRRAASLDIEELLSYPIDEAVVNVLPVDVRDEDGRRHERHLVVGVRAETIQRLRAIARTAGLRMVGIDLTPLALARALPVLEADPERPWSELVVDIGPEVTHLVVRVGDRSRFVRVLTSSTDDESALVASELEMQLSSIASFRGESAAADTGMSLWHPVIVGIRSTIDYYQSLPASPTIASAVVTGTGPTRESTASSLASLFGLEVRFGEPLGWTPALGPAAGFDAAVGAGLLGRKSASVLDLRSEEERAASRRSASLTALLASAGVLGVALGFDGTGRRADAADLATRAATAEAEAAAATAEAGAALQTDFAALTAEAQFAIEQLTTVLASEVDMVEVVDRVAATVPDHTFLTSFAISTTTGTTDETGQTTALASIDVAGDAPDYAGVADWLSGVGDLPFLTGGWVTNSSMSGGDGESAERATFSASADLSENPGTNRLGRFLLSSTGTPPSGPTDAVPEGMGG